MVTFPQLQEGGAKLSLRVPISQINELVPSRVPSTRALLSTTLAWSVVLCCVGHGRLSFALQVHGTDAQHDAASYPCFKATGFYKPRDNCRERCCVVPPKTPEGEDSPNWLATVAARMEADDPIFQPAFGSEKRR